MYLTVMGLPQYDTFLMLRQTWQLMEKTLNKNCRGTGITLPALEVLYLVNLGPKPMNIYQLSRIIGREHHSVFEHVNRLVRKGLINKDVRGGKAILSMTEEGNRLLGEALGAVFADPAFAVLSNEQLQQLRDLLAPLRKACMEELDIADLGEMRIATADGVSEV